MLWKGINHQNQNICIGGKTTTSSDEKIAHNTIHVSASSLLHSKVWVTSSPLMFQVYLSSSIETGSLTNSLMRMLLKNQYFKNAQEQLEKSIS